MKRSSLTIRLLQVAFLCAALAISLSVATNGVAANTKYAPGKPQAHVLQEPAGGALSTSIDWNTFLGGEEREYGGEVALDGAGNIFVTGISYDTWGDPIRDYTPNGGRGSRSDVFVAKLDPQGHLLWNTFLGSDDVDSGAQLAIDDEGSVFVTGTSIHSWGSPNRPLSIEGYAFDSFVAKADRDGNLAWNTFLGGDGDEGYGHIATDSDGYLYVTGSSDTAWGCDTTPCTNRPFVGGDEPTEMDGFVAQLDPDGNLIWNTFLGGDANDSGGNISISPSGDLYVVGLSRDDWGCATDDCTQRAFTGDRDGYLAMLDSGGALVWNTFLGGGGPDRTSSLVVNRDGQIAVSGSSDQAWSCTDAPCTLRSYSGEGDAFVALLAPNGVLRWNTFLGGAAADYCTELAEGTGGRFYITGTSHDTWGEPDREKADYSDVYVAILEPSGDLIWNSFIGT